MTGYTAAVKGSEAAARHPYPYTEFIFTHTSLRLKLVVAAARVATDQTL